MAFRGMTRRRPLPHLGHEAERIATEQRHARGEFTDAEIAAAKRRDFLLRRAPAKAPGEAEVAAFIRKNGVLHLPAGTARGALQFAVPAKAETADGFRRLRNKRP